MTAQEYTKAMQRLGWNHEQAAAEFGVNQVTTWRYAKGKIKVPPTVERLIEIQLLLRRLPQLQRRA